MTPTRTIQYILPYILLPKLLYVRLPTKYYRYNIDDQDFILLRNDTNHTVHYVNKPTIRFLLLQDNKQRFQNDLRPFRLNAPQPFLPTMFLN